MVIASLKPDVIKYIRSTVIITSICHIANEIISNGERRAILLQIEPSNVILAFSHCSVGCRSYAYQDSYKSWKMEAGSER
jgi:hypothetical protein